MKHFIVALSVLMAATFTMAAQNGKEAIKKTDVYIFGIGASFKDSTAYLTPVQKIDSAAVLKDGTLIGMSYYSNQLKQYLESQGKKNQTCIVFYALKEKEAQKKYNRLHRRFVEDKTVYAKDLQDAGFHFQAVNYKEFTITPDTTPQKQKNKERRQNHGERPGMGGGEMPGMGGGMSGGAGMPPMN